MIKLENLEKRLTENGFIYEVGNFETEHGNYAVRLELKNDTQKFNFFEFCRVYQIQGIIQGNFLYCYYI
jgi:hypothetical protein